MYFHSTDEAACPLSFPGIPSEKAWGKKKKVYYDADQHKEKDLGKFWEYFMATGDTMQLALA